MCVTAMLRENHAPQNRQSALERRISMGLDTMPESATPPEIDLQQFEVTGLDDSESDEE